MLALNLFFNKVDAKGKKTKKESVQNVFLWVPKILRYYLRSYASFFFYNQTVW